MRLEEWLDKKRGDWVGFHCKAGWDTCKDWSLFRIKDVPPFDKIIGLKLKLKLQ